MTDLDDLPALPVIRTVELYPGGPVLYIPPDWTEAQIAAALARLRAAAGHVNFRRQD